MTNAEPVDGTASDSKAGKYLTFRLGAEEYGLEILKVREINGLMDITKVPRAPSHVRGVINLRGKVIPVLDLRLKFCMESVDDTEQTCIIVVDANVGGTSMMTGIVVDSVSEVLDIQEDQIEDSPDFGVDVDTNFILGIGKIKDEVKILLDIDRVLDSDDISRMSRMGNEVEATGTPEISEEALASVGA
jgi:purine-binding chemotaxis protein CheW